MNNLLAAGFRRLWKNKYFHICLAVMLVMTIFIMLHSCQDVIKWEEYDNEYTLDMFYYNCMPALGLFSAVFISLFIGTEYSDGTIRNKIIAGKTREQIYLSTLAICIVASLCFLAVNLIGGLVGIPFLGFLTMEIQNILIYLIICVLLSCSLTAILNLLCMLQTNKAVAGILSLLLMFSLLLISSTIYYNLSEPEMVSGVIVTAEGVQLTEPNPNPYYVGGIKRDIYQFILDILPIGQGIELANLELEHPIVSAAGSIFITISTTLAGLWLFKKKDLK